MAQGHVVEAGEGLHAHPIDIADGEFPFGLGGLPASHEGMSHQHRTVIGPPLQIPADPLQRQAGHVFMAQAGRNRCSSLIFRTGQAGAINCWLQIGQRVDRHWGAAQPGAHQHRFVGPTHLTPDRHPERGQQRVVHRHPHMGIVVACDRHHRGSGLSQLGQGVVEQLHRLGRRDRPVVEVAGDQHRIDGPVPGQFNDPRQGHRLLLEQRGPMETASQVPVGGVKQAHRQELALSFSLASTLRGRALRPAGARLEPNKGHAGGGNRDQSCVARSQRCPLRGRQPLSRG